MAENAQELFGGCFGGGLSCAFIMFLILILLVIGCGGCFGGVGGIC